MNLLIAVFGLFGYLAAFTQGQYDEGSTVCVCNSKADKMNYPGKTISCCIQLGLGFYSQVFKKGPKGACVMDGDKDKGKFESCCKKELKDKQEVIAKCVQGKGWDTPDFKYEPMVRKGNPDDPSCACAVDKAYYPAKSAECCIKIQADFDHQNKSPLIRCLNLTPDKKDKFQECCKKEIKSAAVARCPKEAVDPEGTDAKTE